MGGSPVPKQQERPSGFELKPRVEGARSPAPTMKHKEDIPKNVSDDFNGLAENDNSPSEPNVVDAPSTGVDLQSQEKISPEMKAQYLKAIEEKLESEQNLVVAEAEPLPSSQEVEQPEKDSFMADVVDVQETLFKGISSRVQNDQSAGVNVTEVIASMEKESNRDGAATEQDGGNIEQKDGKEQGLSSEAMAAVDEMNLSGLDNIREDQSSAVQNTTAKSQTVQEKHAEKSEVGVGM